MQININKNGVLFKNTTSKYKIEKQLHFQLLICLTLFIQTDVQLRHQNNRAIEV